MDFFNNMKFKSQFKQFHVFEQKSRKKRARNFKLGQVVVQNGQKNSLGLDF